MSRYPIGPQPELAPSVPVDLGRLRQPQYGRYLDDFVPNQIFVHPRGYSFERSAMRDFATTFMQTNPLYLNAEVARVHGFRDIPASPQMVFNVVLSLGVQNDSEKAIANLGYYQAQFLRPVYAGDTLRAFTFVVDRKDRGAESPGIVHIRTVGTNQRHEVVLQYERKIMVRWRGSKPVASPPSPEADGFPWENEPAVELPTLPAAVPMDLTGPNTYFEDFAVGDVIVHANGRTITDEHLAYTYAVGNTHPLHYDRIYSTALSGPMSGEPIVYGGLVFAWLDGLASRDTTENALWELGFTEGYHTQPAFSGDTVFALSRVLAVEAAPSPWGDHLGVVTFQLIGVKNERPKALLDAHGAALFEKESNKRRSGNEKIANKIFEIERRVLLKKRAG
ncbi:MAG: MaoC family dehydratase [Myxococcales bacterium]|nr:MaoC family dehydratase [Myxococcales bacterium]